MASLEKRVKLLIDLKENPRDRSAIIELCRRDILFWYDWFAVTYDPRMDYRTSRPKGVIPFNLYDYQRETILNIQQHITSGKDLLIEKCRDMGISWIVLTVYFYNWLFIPDSNFRIGSRNINEVDRPGDMSTMFEKLREVLRNTPTFLRPQGFNWKRHAAFARLVNPANGASIIGETANPSFGRSARNTSALLDEHAFWEAGDAAWESCGATTPCRIAVSTPWGSYNRFARMAMGKISDKPDKITLHWWLNPQHDEAWFKDQERRYSPSGLAREVLISYASSVEGGVFDMFNAKYHCPAEIITATPQNPEALYVPNPDLPIIVSLDFGHVNCALLSQVDNHYNIRVFHEIILGDSGGRGTTEDLAKAVLMWMTKYNSIHPHRTFNERPLAGPGSDENLPRYSYIFTGDPAGQTHPWQTNEAFSDHDILAKFGIKPLQIDKVVRARNRLQSGVSLLQTLMSTRFRGVERFQVVNPDKCQTLILGLQGEYRYRLDKNGDMTETIHEVHPIEDVMDCLRYTALQFCDVMPELVDNHRARGNSVIKSPYVFPI